MPSRTPASTPPRTSGAALIELDDHIARVTLNRPAAANARNQAMRDDLTAIWRWCADEPAVHAVVLTAAGDRHFCAGMDLKEAGGNEPAHVRRDRMRSNRDVELLAGLPQPTIAAVNGTALGGGLEMALACDLRVFATEARVGLPEVTHGLMPGGGATFRLPRLIGLGRTYELLYLGTTLAAPDAVSAGLAIRHVPRADLDREVTDLAREIASRDARAMRSIKEAVRAGLDQPDRVSADRELDSLLWLLAARAHETTP